ncbi:MAG: carboxyl transferase domain-containing protein [Pseudomonadota bacterium]|jgi:acetyl/propionyl-CoA carboxylase alpha subunit/acetyl-CoA carboxylase carboxyltransferase component
MAIARLLIANRGEIAIRIAAAAAELGVSTVSVYAEDDARSLHRFRTDDSAPLEGSGPAAYLDAARLVAVARRHGCDAVHPGYGFLAESAAFARACEEAGLNFVGPAPRVLELLADKARARELARRLGVPVLPGSAGPVTMDDALAFLHGLGAGAAMVIKAVAGGGGRGIRVVATADEVAPAWRACQAEARQAFGDDALFVERFLPHARHVEVQVVADRAGGVVHAGERECSLQRRHQKLVELAPSPGLAPRLRERITAAAVAMAREAGCSSLVTFEFLLDGERMRTAPEDAPFAFMEANPRLQVEHTVTEEVMGIDLVQAQLRIAGGATLAELGFGQARFEAADGFALQARVNLETLGEDGRALPATGTLSVCEMPAGRGVRVDGCGHAGHVANPRYDSLLAKVVVHARTPDLSVLLHKARRVLADCRVEGAATNLAFLQALVARPEIADGSLHVRLVDERLPELLAEASRLQARPAARPAAPDPAEPHAQGRVDGADPQPLEAGCVDAQAPMPGTVAEVDVVPGDTLFAGQTLAVIEAMKMVHAITAPAGGRVRHVLCAPGQVVRARQRLFVIEPLEAAEGTGPAAVAEADLDRIRPDLAAILERRRLGQDAARPEAVARRHGAGRRTARENVDDLCDPGSFVEYGALAIAAQRRRRSVDDLARHTPADGIVAGIGHVNGARFGPQASRCAVLAYDYTVLAGTQGHQTHRKKDRLLEIAERDRLPVVVFSEGGGGRPGDIDVLTVAGLEVASFHYLARLSGLVPLVGINAGLCFAGNAALLGCCDVVIATRDSSIGMGGPAMIEGGGLGVYRPEEIGPMSVQVPNGVVDIAVADEAEAVAAARKYLGYFQGRLDGWQAHDQRRLRALVPEDRRRTYAVRAVIDALADLDSVLELRAAYGRSIVTALARIEGHPVGILASDPMHLGGAIDGPSADKAARFMQLCDAHDVPMLSLCDTPGFMVGPDSERTAVVRRFARLFVTGASSTTPLMAVVLRKAYGLGAMSMLGGHSRVPRFTVSWPSGEFGGMGLEGAVRLGLRKELAAIPDEAEREAFFRSQVAAAYEFGKAANAASLFEVDEVIDPAETRRWIAAALAARPAPAPRSGKKRNHVDTW